MVSSIKDAISAYSSAASGALAGAAGKDSSSVTGATSINDLLGQVGGDFVSSVKGGEKVASQALIGKSNLTDVVTAVGNAELSLQTVVAIRDKVLQAYQEVMRTNI